MVSISTIGYGDISGTTDFEMQYLAAVTIFSTGIFGYIVSSVTNIFENASKTEDEYRAKLLDLNTYFRYTKIPNHL